MRASVYFNSALIVLVVSTFCSKLCGCDQSKIDAFNTCHKSEDGHDMEHCVSEKNKQCKLTPQIFEGPFFLPNQPNRSDIREGRLGVPLQIEFIIRNTDCQPVKGADVHLWHADAMGVYSGYMGYYPLGDPNAEQIQFPHSEPTEHGTFLRGIQTTDAEGRVKFSTIYPGWYRFRTLHIHFKITIAGREKYTGEMFFPDELTDQVMKIEPYNKLSGSAQRVKNKQDSQFLQDDGMHLVVKPKGDVSKGLEGLIEIII